MILFWTLLTLQAVSAGQANWNALFEGAAAVRVQDGKGAMAKLSLALPEVPDPDEKRVKKLLSAQAKYINGDPLGALEELRDSNEKSLLRTAELLTKLRILKSLNKGDEAKTIAKEIAATNKIPTLIRIEAQLTKAHFELMEGSTVEKQKALKSLEKLLLNKNASVFQPVILEKLSQNSSGKAETKWLKQLLIGHGDSEAGRRALNKIDRARLTEKERLQRVNKLMSAWSNELADEDLIPLEKSKNALTRQKAHLLRASIRMRLRERYPEALALLKKACDGPNKSMADQAWYRRGLVLGNMHRWREATSAMKTLVRRKPSSRYLKKAAYQFGRLQHQSGDFINGGAEIERYVNKHGPKEWRWFVGWSHFRAGNYAKARADWAWLKKSRVLKYGAKARYWTARALFEEGKREQGRKEIISLLSVAPDSYYGIQARALYKRAFPNAAEPPVSKVKKLRRTDRRDMRELISGQKSQLKQKIRQIQLLVMSGFPDLARSIADESTKKKLIAASPQRKIMAKQLDIWLELWEPRWRKKANKVIQGGENLARFSAYDQLESLPAAYHELAQAAGKRWNVSSWWLIAHMLQESHFRENAVSHAGALGPMQILPITGRKIDQHAGFTDQQFDKSTLFRPGIALRNAAWYLNALRHEFKGSELLAITAYNGGPRRVTQLLEDNGTLPFDVFVEEIGAHETREYLKKVCTHLSRYLQLYADPSERQRIMQEINPPDSLPKPRGLIRF